jgi:mycofactocin precursor
VNEPTTKDVVDTAAVAPAAAEAPVETLVEDVSIVGMCGVY